MKRMIYNIVIGLVLAGIVHISIVLLIPSQASMDAWSKLESTGPSWKFHRVTSSANNENQLLSSIDPLFQIAACRFSLQEAPLKVHGLEKLPFWSVAVFDRLGKNVYSFNNRTAIKQKLNLLVVNPVQMAILRQDPPDDVKEAIVVESDIGIGFVLLRALQSDLTWAPAVDQFLKQTSCQKFEL